MAELEQKATYNDVAPLVSQFIDLKYIPTMEKIKVKTYKDINKKIVQDVLIAEGEPSNIAHQLGLKKMQVANILKEYEAAIKFKNQ
jgi:hypothetical protein